MSLPYPNDSVPFPSRYQAANIEATRWVLAGGMVASGTCLNPTRLNANLALVLKTEAATMALRPDEAAIARSTLAAATAIRTWRLPRLTQGRARMLIEKPHIAVAWKSASAADMIGLLKIRPEHQQWVPAPGISRPLADIPLGLMAGRTLDQLSLHPSWLDPARPLCPNSGHLATSIISGWRSLVASGLSHGPGFARRQSFFPHALLASPPRQAARSLSGAAEELTSGRAIPGTWRSLSRPTQAALYHAILLIQLDQLSRAIDWAHSQVAGEQP